jgi:hypothetical protein
MGQRVEFELGVDQMVAFMTSKPRSAAAQNAYLRMFIATEMLFVVLAFLIWTGHFTLASRMIVLIPVIAWLPYFPWMWKRRLEAATRRTYEAQSARFGHRSVELSAEGVHETTPAGESTVKWSGIQKVETAAGFLLLHAGPTSAFLIPLTAFGSPEQADAFIRTANDYLRAARAPG